MRNLSVDEILTVLNHTNLPTILVEGQTDVKIYRYIENNILEPDANVLQCYGKNQLLKIYERRNEIKNDVKIVFLADKDMWVYDSPPNKYDGVIFTTGYSIENDIISGSLPALLKLLDESDKNIIDEIFDNILSWYTIEVLNYLQGKDYTIDKSIKELIDRKTYKLRKTFCDNIKNTSKYNEVFCFINSDRELYLRGKTVLEIYEYILNRPGRNVRYNNKSIIDLLLRFDLEKNVNLKSTISKIEEEFSDYSIRQMAL